METTQLDSRPLRKEKITEYNMHRPTFSKFYLKKSSKKRKEIVDLLQNLAKNINHYARKITQPTTNRAV